MSTKISIVTVCYNAVNVLEQTILSVINQTYDNIEYIVIDGSSKDGTLDVINKYRNHIDYFISEPDKGVYDAMNKAIKVATGEWINFMNAGDRFFSTDSLSSFFSDVDDGYDVVFGETVGERKGVFYKRECKPFYENLPLHQSMGFVHQSAFVKTKIAQNNLFDLKYRLAADYNMMISLYRQGYKFLYIKKIVAFYEGGGLSDKKMYLHIRELFDVDYPNRSDNKREALILFMKNHAKKRIGDLITFIMPQSIQKLIWSHGGRTIISH